MKKLILISIFVTFGFAQVAGCKKKDSMYAIADASDRKSVFMSLYYNGECNIVDEIKVVDYSGRLKKVLASDGQYYWVINQ